MRPYKLAGCISPGSYYALTPNDAIMPDICDRLVHLIIEMVSNPLFIIMKGKSMYPMELLYSREHEWVRTEGDIAVLGITEYAQQELGEVVFVELPEVGQVFSAGDEVGTIESVKAVAEIYSPLAGEISAINDAVVDDPELLNEDPHGEGWLIKIRYSSAEDLNRLMNAEQYEEYIKSGEA